MKSKNKIKMAWSKVGRIMFIIEIEAIDYHSRELMSFTLCYTF